ncbi:hypothetical protein BKA66DRAFT_588524 [Pyrenochaeta sp. MPI-SDFR-AT-0127]|nr:hypothetical protein BKA66DRAFT_588524 [Pyrenochaeta sp. MPI-SDFR-AT-0127]
MAVPFTLTPEKVEGHLGANHIGHFLLRSCWRRCSDHNAPSAMYQFSPELFDNYNFSDGKTYNAWEAYGQSKTANILFAVALAKKLEKKGIKSYSLHPGVIAATGLTSGVDPAAWAIVDLCLRARRWRCRKKRPLSRAVQLHLLLLWTPRLIIIQDHFWTTAIQRRFCNTHLTSPMQKTMGYERGNCWRKVLILKRSF